MPTDSSQQTIGRGTNGLIFTSECYKFALAQWSHNNMKCTLVNSILVKSTDTDEGHKSKSEFIYDSLCPDLYI